MGKNIAEVPSARFLPDVIGILNWDNRWDRVYEIEIDGVRFEAGVDSKDIIEYIGTHAPSFMTPEGAAVGFTLEQARSLTKADVVVEWDGWGSWIAMPSGWRLGFEQMHDSGRKPPQPTAKAEWVFRYDRTDNRGGWKSKLEAGNFYMRRPG
ncbi:MAG: hypothetical protein NT049_16735 [Planctomycetota bacterium]|nr:hypothetical protein [Planctomycetota bacterium]